MSKGILYAVGSYILWGFLPIYMKALHSETPLEILAHRVIWSFVLLSLALSWCKHWQWLGRVLHRPRILGMFCATATLLSINWFTYMWAVQHNHIVDSSLGYFITPLVNVMLGMIFLRERLRPWQSIAVGVAVLGVLYLTVSAATLPWVGLTLAFSFGSYALLRKIAPLNSLEGLSLETLLLCVPAVLYVLTLEAHGVSHFGHAGATTTLLLVFTGVITAVPLLLFAAGARLIALSTLGILQYVAPTIQLIIGVVVYGEAFTQTRMVGFGLIWAALLLFALEGVLKRRRTLILQYAH